MNRLGHLRTGRRRWARREERGRAGPGHKGSEGLGRELDLVLWDGKLSEGLSRE